MARGAIMYKRKRITQEEFKELLEEIYTMGQDYKIIEMSDFIKVVEDKILSLTIIK